MCRGSCIPYSVRKNRYLILFWYVQNNSVRLCRRDSCEEVLKRKCKFDVIVYISMTGHLWTKKKESALLWGYIVEFRQLRKLYYLITSLAMQWNNTSPWVTHCQNWQVTEHPQKVKPVLLEVESRNFRFTLRHLYLWKSHEEERYLFFVTRLPIF